MISHLIKNFRIVRLIALVVAILPLNVLAGFPLPHYSEVAEGDEMLIDGTWLINTNKSRIKISKGRAYAIDSWQVFFATVEPEKTALKNIVYLGQGNFKGEDLTLSGNFNAKIQANAKQ